MSTALIVVDIQEVTIVGTACAAPTAVIGDIALSGLAGRCTVV